MTTATEVANITERMTNAARIVLRDGVLSKRAHASEPSDTPLTVLDFSTLNAFITGWRSDELGENDILDSESNSPGYAACEPSPEYIYACIASFICAMGCDYVVVGGQEYPPVGDTNPATGAAWEEGDAGYMGRFEREAIQKGWIKERIFGWAFHKDGAWLRVDQEITFSEETQNYERVGEFRTVEGHLDNPENDDEYLRYHPARLMVLDAWNSKNISATLWSAAREHVLDHHADRPQDQCDEVYRAMGDLMNSQVLNTEKGEHIDFVLQSMPGTLRAEVMGSHATELNKGETAVSLNHVAEYYLDEEDL